MFLDEIADLPKDLQSNLLRFLQEKTIYRVGATRSITVDARDLGVSRMTLYRLHRALMAPASPVTRAIQASEAVAKGS